MNNFLDKAGLARLWQHILAKIGTKVDKVEGKGLSTNDFTDEDKEKVASIGTITEELKAYVASEVATAVNTALAQAKASGEFDGEDGITPVKGTDYYTEADKTEMVNLVLKAIESYDGEVTITVPTQDS